MGIRMNSSKALSLLLLLVVPVSYAATESKTYYPTEDAEEYLTTGQMSLGSSDLEIGGIDGSRAQVVGLRYANIIPPVGKDIKEVYVQFNTDERSAASNISIQMEVGTNQIFTGAQHNISSRTYTDTDVNWDVPAIQATNQKTADYRTPDLYPLVEASLAQGWDISKGLVFKFTGDGSASSTMDSRNSGLSVAPQLVVIYDDGDGPIDPPPPATTISRTYSIQEDAEEYLTTGQMSLGSSDLEIGGIDGSRTQIVGLRYTNVVPPTDKSIKEVYIQFNTDEYSAASNVSIQMEVGANQVFTGVQHNISSRTYANPNVSWNVPAIQAVNQKTADYRTPDLYPLIEASLAQGWDVSKGFVFKLTGDGSASSTMDSRNSGLSVAPQLIVVYDDGDGPIDPPPPPPPPTNISKTYSIQEDAEESVTNGQMSLGSSDLEIGGIDGSRRQIVGLRYTGITPPANKSIQEMYIQFNTDERSGASSVNIEMEADSNQPFTGGQYNISSRTYLDTGVNWSVPAIQAANQKTDAYRTPNLISLVQHALMEGWDISQGFVFKISGDGSASSTMDSRNSGMSVAPQLIVVYGDGDINSNIEDDPALITDVYVNEVSAKGTQFVSSDWIELYNDHDFPVKLGQAFYLSNKESSLDKFQLNNILIPAKSYTTLFADKKTEEGNRHTNFKLKAKGGTVYLSKEENAIVSRMDKLKYEKSSYNETYGKYPNASDTVIKFREGGTQRRSNENGIQNIDLTFDKSRGVYDNNITVELSTPQDATIKYTTDGSFPSKTHGSVYGGGIYISQNMVVKAIAYSDKGKSKYETNTYVVAKSDSELRYSNLMNSVAYKEALREIPIVSISKEDNRFNSTEKLTTFEYFNATPTDDDKGVSVEAGIKKFGNYSYGYPKPNLRFYFRKEYGHGALDYDIFKEYEDTSHPAVDEFKRLELKIGEDGVLTNDFNLGYSRFSDKLMHDAMLDMGHLDVHSKFVHVFVNGKYHGVETLRERFDDDFAESYLSGDDDDYVRIDNRDGYWHAGRVKESEHRAQWSSVVNSSLGRDYQQIKSKVHMDDYIKMMLMYLSMDTEYEARGVMNTKDSSEKIRFNLNDADGLVWNNHPWANNTHWGSLLQGPGYIFGSFLAVQNLEFMTMVRDNVSQHFGSSGVLTTNYFTSHINELTNSIDKSYKLDVARWGFSSNVHTRWKNETQRIISELGPRFATVLNNLTARGLVHTLPKVLYSESNNSLSLQSGASNIEIYYTTDGSDPMGNDGVISGSSTRYNSGDSIPNATTLTVRAYRVRNWGPKTVY